MTISRPSRESRYNDRACRPVAGPCAAWLVRQAVRLLSITAMVLLSGCASATIAWRSTVTVNQGGYAQGQPSNSTSGGGNVKATVTP